MQPPVPGYPAPVQPTPYGSGPYGPSPYGPQPYGGYGPGLRMGLPRPTAVAPVPGTAFGVALVEVRSTTSGPAVASLITGIVTVLLSLVVLIFDAAYGLPVAGAFALLGVLVGGASVGLATAALYRIRRSVAWGPARGRGVAIAGLSCAGLGLVGIALVVAVGLALTAP